MLTRIQEIIKQSQGDDNQNNEAFKLIEPKCARTKTKSMWLNFSAQSEALDREQHHILHYFMSELGCEGNIGSEKEMILVGAYQAKNFSKLIRKYIEDYVRCKDCKGAQTSLEKEEKTRLQYLRCKKCKASRTV